MSGIVCEIFLLTVFKRDDHEINELEMVLI